jgi:hypothetical protein
MAIHIQYGAASVHGLVALYINFDLAFGAEAKSADVAAG